MKVMMALENVVMDGVKRASTVLANALTDHYDMYYYSLADAPRYFELDAPLIIADPPTDPHRLTSSVANPTKYSPTRLVICWRPLNDLKSTWSSSRPDS